MDDAPSLTANDAVAFFVEVAALVLIGMWGWRLGTGATTKVLGAVATTGVAVVLWGLFAAPKARFDRSALRLLTKVVVLGAAVLVSFTLLSVPWALAFTVTAVVNTMLLYVGPWARR